MKRNKLATIIAILFFVSAILGFWIVFSQSSQKIERKSKIGISQDKIAVVNILGPIRASMKSSDPFARDSEKVVKRLKKLNENASVKAVVLRINSPGGTVAAVQEIYSELLKMKKNGKFIVASFSDVAASGGYYIACAADEIVAQPGTLTGSIGVILEIGNFSELMKKIGVKIETVKSGIHKDIGNFTREMTIEERKILQDLINDAYEQFLSAVVTGRKLDEAKARTLADGRIFTGTQAKSAGLVDTLGGLDEAIEEAKKLAGIKGEVKIISDSDQWDKIFEFIPAGFEEKAFSKIIPSMNVRFEYIL
ncbi:MAG: signal peptide peptidase SppA, partial [Elusimicrobiota bacterium]|nr:signal peptide peptidase SppA [Elusimicrobiota bacterium]